MSEEYNDNQYGQEGASVNPYNVTASWTASTPKKKPVGSMIGIVICVLVILLSSFLLVILQIADKETVTEQETTEFYYVTEEGQNCYVELQYMTESFASFELYEKQQFYFSFNEYFYPAVVCMDDDMAQELYAYIEYTYTEDESYPVPEPRELTGYSVKMDAELVSFAIESYYGMFGYQYTEEEFYNDFGEYYLNVGEKAVGVEETSVKTPILIMLIIAAVLLIIFIITYKRAVNPKKNSSFLDVEMTRAVPGEKVNINVGAGIIGAFLGALLGGILWIMVGMVGFVVGWIGILMMLFALNGYKKLGKGLDKTGVVISVILSLLMIVAAEYVSWAITYYKEVNNGIAQISLLEAFTQLPTAMTGMELWGDMAGDIAVGFVLTGIAALYSLPVYLKDSTGAAVGTTVGTGARSTAGTVPGNLNRTVHPNLLKDTVIMLVSVFASLILGFSLIVAEDENVIIILLGLILLFGGTLVSAPVYCVLALKKWTKAVFYDEKHFRIGRSKKGVIRNYTDIMGMNQDEEGNYVLRMYSGESITVPAKYIGADVFAALVREKLANQML